MTKYVRLIVLIIIQFCNVQQLWMNFIIIIEFQLPLIKINSIKYQKFIHAGTSFASS